jgi:hypothetical protein
MRLVDFLIYLLEAQAETLKRLAAFFGEERFLEMLENSGDEIKIPTLDKNLIPFESPSNALTSGSTYRELEGAVREFKLPEFLEFHLWAYPYYRAFIESEMDLSSRLASNASAHLIDEALAQAKEWIKQLPIPPAISFQAEAAAQLPWIRFRTQVLKKVGIRPMGAIT